VRLTAAGRALLDPGRDVLAAADSAFATAQEAARGLTGTVTVGATSAIGPVEREEIAGVLRSGGDVTVSIAEVRPGSMQTLLRRRELDVAVHLTQLDGHRILTWNEPGTAFTDLLVNGLAAAGAIVGPVEARITGGTLLDLAGTDAVALLPRSWPLSGSVVAVRLLDDMTLLMPWPAGTDPQAIRRLRLGLS